MRIIYPVYEHILFLTPSRTATWWNCRGNHGSAVTLPIYHDVVVRSDWQWLIDVWCLMCVRYMYITSARCNIHLLCAGDGWSGPRIEPGSGRRLYHSVAIVSMHIWCGARLFIRNVSVDVQIMRIFPGTVELSSMFGFHHQQHKTMID